MIVKCSHCHKMLSEESFDTHECDLPLTRTKTIEVVYFRDDSVNSNQRVTGRGIDGILYAFEVVPRKAIPITIPLSRRKVTPFRTDEDETEPCIELLLDGKYVACQETQALKRKILL